MNIFETIVSKIFTHSPANAQAATSAQPAPTAGVTTSSAAKPVDVEQILTSLAQKNSEKLNWQTSIVDLMKLLGLDSSLAARKQLAQELKYTGDSNDSSAMNIWLSKQVLAKLAQNGGVVPPELKH